MKMGKKEYEKERKKYKSFIYYWKKKTFRREGKKRENEFLCRLVVCSWLWIVRRCVLLWLDFKSKNFSFRYKHFPILLNFILHFSSLTTLHHFSIFLITFSFFLIIVVVSQFSQSKRYERLYNMFSIKYTQHKKESLDIFFFLSFLNDLFENNWKRFKLIVYWLVKCKKNILSLSRIDWRKKCLFVLILIRSFTLFSAYSFIN